MSTQTVGADETAILLLGGVPLAQKRPKSFSYGRGSGDVAQEAQVNGPYPLQLLEYTEGEATGASDVLGRDRPDERGAVRHPGALAASIATVG